MKREEDAVFHQLDHDEAARRARYEDYFRCLDRDGNGTIETADLTHVVARLDCKVPKDARRAITQSFITLWQELHASRACEESITKECFVNFFARAAEQTRKEGHVPDWAIGHLAATMKALDLDCDGGISRREYAAWLEAIGSRADADRAFDRLDLTSSGEISLCELEALFMQWLMCPGADAPGACLMTGRP